MRHLLAAIGIGVLALGTVPAHAVLVDNGNFTTDTASGLDWLDLLESHDLTVAFVQTQIGSGGLFEGWQVANATQVHTFMGNAGVQHSTTQGNLSYTPGDLAAAQAWTALVDETLGATGDFPGYFGSRAQIDDGIANGTDLLIGYYIEPTGVWVNDYCDCPPAFPGGGVWLVRAADIVGAPEPVTAAIFGFSLLGLGVARRKIA